jgi:hypothetical protein
MRQQKTNANAGALVETLIHKQKAERTSNSRFQSKP